MSKKANDLLNEKSPYLLQHAYNPVNWKAWNDDAFDLARKEDKPIFLSIGYSTCHWCHVMEHESFEDEEVADLLNENFVSIKVDREERPDIDNIYMMVCQMVTGRGGWPLTIIMSPDKLPFYAGTYLPKNTRFNNMGMMDLLQGITHMWQTDREKINESKEQITKALEMESEEEHALIDDSVIEAAYRKLLRMYDEENGGFGTAPKFPSPHQISFLLRYAMINKEKSAGEMALHTLRTMRNGGIYDHVGKGFHRYSTDQFWLLPHFEKMLYDQAMLTIACAEAYQYSKDELFKDTALEILEYVSRDMRSENGAFYSAEDADSEGLEGKFYVWEKNEIESVLGNEAKDFIERFNIREKGNYTEEAAGHGAGGNIIHLKNELSKEEKEKFKPILKELFEHREKRVHPSKDKKVLADWNGLMISAYALSARIFDDKDLLNKAKKAYDFINSEMMINGKLKHRWMDGQADFEANIDDLSFMINAQLELYAASFDAKYLKDAIEFMSLADNDLWDSELGGFYFSGKDNKDLIIRRKEIYDGAIPSGNSIMMMNLLRLFKLTGNSYYYDKADLLMKCFSSRVNTSPTAFTSLLSAYMLVVNESYEVTISGDINNTSTELMIKELNSYFIPNMVCLFRSKELEEVSSFVHDQKEINGKSTAYVCKNFSCDAPTNDVNEMLNYLGIKK